MPLEKFPISEQLLNLWLEENIIHGLGYIKVSNNGGCFAWVDEGIYNLKIHGISKQGEATKDEQLRIFRALITKHKNFERNGYSYRFYQGCWQRNKYSTLRNV